jgi:hypothetical protein
MEQGRRKAGESGRERGRRWPALIAIPACAEFLDVCAGPSSSLFAPENAKALQDSFRQFISRPENRPLVEAQQSDEVRRAVQLQDEFSEAVLNEHVSEWAPWQGHPRVSQHEPEGPVLPAVQVLSLPLDKQQRVERLVAVPLLRRMLRALCNSPPAAVPARAEGGQPAAAQQRARQARHSGTLRATGNATPSSGAVPGALAAWLENGLVLSLLEKAAMLLEQGRVSEPELECLLLAHIQVSMGQPPCPERQQCLLTCSEAKAATAWPGSMMEHSRVRPLNSVTCGACQPRGTCALPACMASTVALTAALVR